MKFSIGISVAKVQVSSHTAYPKRILATEKREHANAATHCWKRHVLDILVYKIRLYVPRSVTGESPRHLNFIVSAVSMIV